MEDLDEAVAVVGGGFAGFSAALHLAAEGIPVTVFESAATLGGRARKVHHRGQEIDNGQHILLGAYSETLKLLGQLEMESACLRLPLSLEIDEFSLRLPRLPAPLNLAAGILFARGLSLGEKRSTIRFVASMKRNDFVLSNDMSVGELLASFDESENAIQFLWEPLCVSALNTPLSEASAAIFLNVLKDALFAGRAASDLLLPKTNLSALFPEAAARRLADMGGKVLVSTPVRSIARENARLLLGTDVGDRHFRKVICAVPPYRLASLLGSFSEFHDALAMVAQFSYQPILTVYLQYPESFTLSRPMLGQAGKTAHWFFDRGLISGQRGLIAAVVSAKGKHSSLSLDEISEAVQAELRAKFPGLPHPLWVKTIHEKRATFSSTPGLARPKQSFGNSGIYLAGDYTEGAYPATIEGAVRSGKLAAQLAMK